MIRTRDGAATGTLGMMDDQTHEREPYWLAATRPLASLVFLLPMVVAYQVGSVVLLDGGGTIWAEQMLNRLFGVFGVIGQALPAILLVTVLLVRHVLEKRAWSVRLGVLGAMAGECVLWTIPLVLIAGLISLVSEESWGLQQSSLEAMDWRSRLMIALGAGLYEELLFRLIAITVLHTLVVDLFRAPERAGRVISVVISAIAFAWYHDPNSIASFAFFALAGVIFGVLFLWRGFGITAGTHALYDVLVLVVLAG